MFQICIVKCPSKIGGTDTVPKHFLEGLVGLLPIEANQHPEAPNFYTVRTDDIAFQLALARRPLDYLYWQDQQRAGKEIISLPADCCQWVAEMPDLVQ